MLKQKFTSFITDSNKQLLEHHCLIIENLVLSNSKEIFGQVRGALLVNENLNYYISSPLKNNMLDTKIVKEYLMSIKESNQNIISVEIFYPANNLLVNNEKIRYDLFYAHRKNELKPYSDLMEVTMNDTRLFFAVAESDTLSISRAIISGEKVNALLVVNYSVKTLREHLQSQGAISNSSFFILGEKGQILFSSDDAEYHQSMFDDTKYSTIFTNTNGNTSTYITKDKNIASIISFKNNGKSEWKYVTITMERGYLEPIYYIIINLIIAAGLTLLTGFILVIIVSLRQSKPISSIISICENISWKIYGVNANSGENNFILIKNTLNKLIDFAESRNRQLTSLMPVLKEYFLLWLMSDEENDSLKIEKNLVRYGIKFDYRNYCILAIKAVNTIPYRDTIDSDIGTDGEFKYDLALAKIRIKIEQLFNPKNSFVYFYKKDAILIGVLNFDFGEENFIYKCSEITGSSLQGCNIYVSASQVMQNLTDLVQSKQDTINALKYSFLFPEIKNVYLKNENSYVKENIGAASVIADNFIYNLKFQKYQSCLSELDTLVNEIRNKKYDIEDIMILLRNIQLEISKMDNIDNELRNTIIESIQSSPNILYLRNKLNNIIRLHHLNNSSKSQMEIVIRAKKYIEKNLLDPNLSLQNVARNLSVGSTYLSRVFSEEENMTFIDYITSAKLELGRRLLIETDFVLNDISERLNYASPQYFISLFKKHYSVTPGAYRKEYKNSQEQVIN